MHYSGEYLNEISFPLGGIGTGRIGLSGTGRFRDWEIANRPAKGSINGYTHIAVSAVKGKKRYVKILNGDQITELCGHYKGNDTSGMGGFGIGPAPATMAGFEHFKNCDFTGEFPIARIGFSDEAFPGRVILTAFNPLIPLNDLDSSLPAAFFDVECINDTEEDILYTVYFSVANPFDISENADISNSRFAAVKMINAQKKPSEKGYGDLTLATDKNGAAIQQYWYRGQWMDGITTYWNEINGRAEMNNRVYDSSGSHDTCTVSRSGQAKKDSSFHSRFILSWNYPNNYNYWTSKKDAPWINETWKNYYAVKFLSSEESAFYSLEKFDELYEKTKLFKDTLFSQTLDPAVLDAVSSTLSVLKSATVFRLEDGSFYGWEGTFENTGSCEGTCQHVWNYAYALCFLFPPLERSIKDLEFKYSMLPSGEMTFRLKLPLGRTDDRFRPCLDGQMGTVIKCFRDWKISGDDEWLKKNWENIKKALEFAWSPENNDEWDKNKDGVLEGRQHHTLDMELFGPSSWLEGFYLAALSCAYQIAEYLDDKEKAEEYKELFIKGKKWTTENLFNGKWFIQKIDLSDKSITEHFACPNYWNEETKEIKYQIAEGSEIDQLCAQWHANISGIGEIFDPAQVKTALYNMYQNNFKKSMRGFTNLWRNFSVNDDAGAVICDYPEGTYKPMIPIPYCEETMHGFEYQFAALLVMNGFIDEGLEVVRAIRKKYDGKHRNPWNEIECGSNYARSMASFSLINAFSGFSFDLPHFSVGFCPVEGKEYFKCLWSLGTGWGYFERSCGKATLKILSGKLCLETFSLPFISGIKDVFIDSEKIQADLSDGKVHFDKTDIYDKIEVIF